MDSITHTLFGLAIYNGINKDGIYKKEKRLLLTTAIIGSHLPDSDVISKYFDTHGLYQMWHRGITHSIFMVPIWATLLFLMSYIFFKNKNKMVFYVGLLSVFIHITSDLFNAWGTGYLEPFSSRRISFGTIPIIDFVVWGLVSIGFIVSSIRKERRHIIFKFVLIAIMGHFLVQSVQGYYIYQQVEQKFDQIALSASFIPWHFNVIGKKNDIVEISEATVWSGTKLRTSLKSKENTSLETLFKINPKAKTLYTWSPFVVVVDNEKKIGIYDPRFYRNGQSFLFEYIEKGKERK